MYLSKIQPSYFWTFLGDGVRLGTVLNGAGDPQTPGWPSVPYAHRVTYSNDDDAPISAIPKIPIQPISYSDARNILKHLGGEGMKSILCNSVDQRRPSPSCTDACIAEKGHS